MAEILKVGWGNFKFHSLLRNAQNERNKRRNKDGGNYHERG